MGPEFEKGDGRLRAYNNASPAQRGPRRDAQPTHATPLAAVIFLQMRFFCTTALFSEALHQPPPWSRRVRVASSSRRTLAVFRRPPTVAALPVHPFATAAE